MGKYITDELIEEIRISNDIVDVVSEYVNLEKKGKYMFGLCPFHREKTASFSVTKSKQMYYCYSCGKGGNVIHFIRNIENLEYIEAVKFLANRAKIEIPEGKDPQDIKLANLKKKLYELNKVAARFFYSKLNSDEGKLAREYLRKRSLSENTLRKFGIGYSSENWDALYLYLKKNNFEQEVIEKSGLVLAKKNNGFYDRFRGRIIFPIFDLRGNIIGFGGRIMEDGQPKYLNSPETPVYSKGRNLYLLNFAKNFSQERLIIVEGYMDAISLHQVGIKNVVASLGTALTEQQARIIKKYTQEVILSYDSDEAGQRATMRALKIFSDVGVDAKVLIIPNGKDPDEFVKKFGKESFEELINNSLSFFEYKLKNLKETIDITTVPGKVKFLNEIAKILSNIYNNVEREVYIKKVSKDYDISEESILREIYRLDNSSNNKNKLIKSKGMKEQRILEKSDTHKSRLSHYEKLILILLSDDNNILKHVEKDLEAIEFSDEGTRQIKNEVIGRIKNQEGIVFGELLNLVDEDVANEYVKIYQEECNFENNEKAVLDIIKKVKIIQLDNKQHEIVALLGMEENKDMEKQRLLKNKLNEIIKEKRNL